MPSTFYVESASTKVVDEYPDLIRDAVITAVVNNENIPQYIMSTAFNNFAQLANRYYQYGKLGETSGGAKGYLLGLPSGTINSGTIDTTEVQQIIELELGVPIKNVNGFISSPNLYLFGEVYLQDTYGWTYKTDNILINGKNYSYNGTFVPVINPNNEYGVKLLQNDALPGDIPDEITDIVPEPNMLVSWYHISYALASNPSDDIVFWVYEHGSGGYPTLDIPLTSLISSEVYPIIPLKIDGEYTTTADPALFDSALKAAAILKVDLNNLIDSIEANTQTDPDNVDDIFLLFGASIYTLEEATKWYLFEHFKDMYAKDQYSKSSFDTARARILAAIANNDASRFQDINQNYIFVDEQDYQQELRYNYITLTADVAFTLPPNVKYDIQIVELADTYYQKPGTTYDPLFPENTVIVIESQLIIRERVTDTTVNEILVHGLLHTTRVIAQGVQATIIRRMTNNVDDQLAFYVPLNKTTMNKISKLKEQLVFLDSMILVFNAVQIVDLEWYQTTLFQGLIRFFLILISVIFFAITLGKSVQMSAFLWALFTQFALGMVINFVIDFLIENVGSEFAVVLALVAAYFYGGTNFQGLKNLPFADALLGAVAVVTTVVQIDIEYQAELLADDVAQFLEDSEERDKALEEAQANLGDSLGFNPLATTTVAQPMSAYETPDQFFTRTIHTGNPGVLSLDSIEGYVANLLRLPEFQEVGDNHAV